MQTKQYSIRGKEETEIEGIEIILAIFFLHFYPVGWAIIKMIDKGKYGDYFYTMLAMKYIKSFLIY